MSALPLLREAAFEDPAPTDFVAADGTLDRNAVSALRSRYGHLTGKGLIGAMAHDAFAGRFAVVSSFGSESAVLLHMAAEVDPAIPVIFLDTEKLFPETLAYRDQIVARLGLTGVRVVTPDPVDVGRLDAQGDLWRRDPNACCALRKVWPLDRALQGFVAWATGRKRYQGGARSSLPAIEVTDGRIKINPLINFSPDDIDAYYRDHGLPRHPLFESGFLSLGCAPCTRAVREGEDARAGRWADTDKTECGLHR